MATLILINVYFFPDSESPIFGLLSKVSFVSEFFWKYVIKNTKRVIFFSIQNPSLTVWVESNSRELCTYIRIVLSSRGTVSILWNSTMTHCDLQKTLFPPLRLEASPRNSFCKIWVCFFMYYTLIDKKIPTLRFAL